MYFKFKALISVKSNIGRLNFKVHLFISSIPAELERQATIAEMDWYTAVL